MKKSGYRLLLIIVFILLIGCKKNIDLTDDKTNMEDKEDIEEVLDKPKDNIINEIEETSKGQAKSFFTGQWMDEKKVYNRPYAIQFSNYKTVKNQWGISEADILYEALVEGGITRIMGLGQNFKAKRIGSVRSARHYYVNFLDAHDAIYIHFGKTKYAKSQFSKLAINNIDGTTGIGNTVFYRVSDLKAPHNAFTSLDKIKKGIKEKKFDKKLNDDYKPVHSFYENDTDIKGEVSNKVTVKFSSYNAPYFEYNKKDKLYYRFQFDQEHKDSNTDKQLAFKNIIIQFVKEWDIDKNGYQTMDLEDATGDAYYITNGKVQKATWKMNEKDKSLSYYNIDGEDLLINPGKTFVELFPDKRVSSIIIE